MFNSRAITDGIEMYLCFIETYISSETKYAKRNDAAKDGEDIIKEALHIITGNQVENVNRQKKGMSEIDTNVPAIDLMDKTANIAYQVTVQYDKTKVTDTLKMYEKYFQTLKESYVNDDTKIRFFFLKYLEKKDDILKNKLEEYKIGEKTVFSPNDGLMNLRALHIMAKDAKKEKELHRYLLKECSVLSRELIILSANGGWRGIPTLDIPSNTVQITPCSNDDASMEWFYGCTADFIVDNRNELYVCEVEVKNISEVPVTEIVFDAFTVGRVSDVDIYEKDYRIILFSQNEGKTVSIADTIYPGEEKKLRIFFCDTYFIKKKKEEEDDDTYYDMPCEGNEVSGYILNINFSFVAKSIYTDMASRQKHYILAALPEEDTAADEDISPLPYGEYAIEDMSKILMVERA